VRWRVRESGRIVELALELHPDAILWQIAPDEDAAPLRGLQRKTQSCSPQMPRRIIRAGAHAYFPSTLGSQIEIALQAAAAGLAVFRRNISIRRRQLESPGAHGGKTECAGL